MRDEQRIMDILILSYLVILLIGSLVLFFTIGKIYDEEPMPQTAITQVKRDKNGRRIRVEINEV